MKLPTRPCVRFCLPLLPACLLPFAFCFLLAFCSMFAFCLLLPGLSLAFGFLLVFFGLFSLRLCRHLHCKCKEPVQGAGGSADAGSPSSMRLSLLLGKDTKNIDSSPLFDEKCAFFRHQNRNALRKGRTCKAAIILFFPFPCLRLCRHLHGKCMRKTSMPSRPFGGGKRTRTKKAAGGEPRRLVVVVVSLKVACYLCRFLKKASSLSFSSLVTGLLSVFSGAWAS